ncbi:hypothetical protein [Curtobacterium ammoniigenes]|uniref:hypothetical protein n=1 Tax=Curtobacterium ammoniigenes TaxID=395387 RepID=UPI0008306E22|nr:hypothetical protein [Curtobacterium ammoniigenes]
MTAPDASSPPDSGVEEPVVPGDPSDDEALSWGGELDATHVDASKNPVIRGAARAPSPERPAGSGSLVGMGVLGGIYLLYTVAWLVSASVLPVAGGTALSALFAEGLRVLAIMAPAFWFVATLWFGQTISVRARFVWLVVGVVVLFPWPFLMTRAF